MLLSGKFGKLSKPISFEMAYTLTSQNFNFNAASVLTFVPRVIMKMFFITAALDPEN